MTNKEKNYITFDRWISYYEQIELIMNIIKKEEINSVLEIGGRRGVLASCLKDITDIEVKTLDNKYPADFNVDVCNMDLDRKFDIVVAFQILEHIPFKKMESIVNNLRLTAKKYVLISLPYTGYTFRLSAMLFKQGRRELGLTFRLPRFWSSKLYEENHFWEVGIRGFYGFRFKRILKRYFKLTKIKRTRQTKANVFYVCKV